MLLSAPAVAVCCLVILSGGAAAMQYAILQPFPRDDESPNSGVQLPGDATRSESEDDDNVQSRWYQAAPWTGVFAPATTSREQRLPFLGASPPPPPDPGPASEIEDPERDFGTAGAGFDSACGPRERCSSSLGLACLKVEHEDYRCGCAKDTPVFINEGGVKKCVRAKSMYESCVSHQECSYQNPNLQCVDFLCYCPLPYVLTEGRRCLAPSSAPHNNMLFIIVPAAVLIAVVLIIGGAYTYKKMAGGNGGRWSRDSALSTPRSATEWPSDSRRRVSSAIRLGHRGGARRPRRSLDEHRAAPRDARGPRRPQQYIRPREQIVQKTFLQDVRVSAIKEEPTQSSELPGFAANRVSPRCSRAANSKAVSVQRILPVDEGVHIVRKSQTSQKTSQELSTEIPWLRHARREGDRRESPTRLLRRMLDEAEVKVNVEMRGSSDSEGAQRPQLPKFSGDDIVSQRSGSPTCKLHERGKEQSTTEDSFMREIRYQVKASSPRPSAQDRAMSTDVAVTKDTAVQPDKTVPDKVDRSQQMSDVPSLGVDDTAIAPVRKLVQMLEHKTASPVEKLTHQIVPKQKAANMTRPPVEKKERERVKPELISPKDVKEKVHEKYDTSSIQENRGHSSTSAGKPLTFLRRIFSDSLTRRSKQAVARDPMPPLSETAKDDSQGALKSHSMRVTTNNTKCTEKTKEDGGSSSTGKPTSPKSGSTAISNPSTTRSLDFRDILQKLIQQHAQNRTAVPSCKDVPLKNIPKQTPPQPSGPTSTASVSATSPALARTNFLPPKDPGKESAFILRSQEVTSNLSPMSPHFYATTIEESNMLCPAVQGKSSDERPTDGGELRCVIRNNTSPDSLKSSTTAVEESPPLLVRSFLDPHTVRDDGNRDETRVIPKQQARHGCSSDNLTTNAEKPSEVYAWGDSLSGSAETPSDQCRLEGYALPNSPGNRDTGQAISLLQGLEATRTPAGVGLEQTYICLRAENDWNMTTPEAVLGSMDLEPSETSLGVLRATFKQSVDVTSRMPVHRDETTVMVHALKDKKTKGSKRKKRVNFEEEPFTVVLAEIEDGYSEPDRPEFAEGNRKAPERDESVVEKSSGSSKTQDEENIDRAFIESRAVVDRTDNREIEDGEKEKIGGQVKPLVAIALDRGGRLATRKIMQRVSAQDKDAGPDRILVDWDGPNELAVPNRELYPAPSRVICSKDHVVSHPFCRSEEGPLLPSASTTLSFLSSDSSVSVVHRTTDLTSLQNLADLNATFQETGDGKSRTGVANLPNTPQPVSHTQQELPAQPPQQHQEGEQQWEGHPMLSPRATSAEDRSVCSSRRLRKLEEANRQDSREDRRSSRLPRRPNTGERQRVGRFAAKEQRWGDDIIQVILMGNKHYLHERSLTSPRPLSPSMAAVPPLDETRYIAQQIDLTHAIDKDVAHTCPSPELCLAAGVVRTVAVPEETAITPAQSRNLSVCDVMQVSPRPGDSALEQQVPPSPSGRVSPHSSPEVCSRPLSVVTSPDPLAATHHRTWGPSGEQRNVETIAEAVCQIELQDPQAIVEALGPKVPELAPGDIFSGDTLELAKSPVQIAVIEDINDHFVTNLVSEPGAENRVASHLWDAREHDLLASVKLLSAAVGTPESFSKSIGLPSSEGLRLSESSTLSSRVDGAVSSSIGCSVVLEPSSSAFSHARTGSPTSARIRRHSAKSLEVPCFESVYNSILQPGSSTGLSLSIPPLGSRDLSGICRVPERPRGSTSESSTIPCPVEDCRDGGAVPVAATTSKSTNLALRLTAPEPSEGGTEVLMPHATNVAAAHGEDCEESIPRTPHFSAEAPPRNGSRCSSSRPPSTTAILDNKAVVGKRLDDAGSEMDERSSFFSFEESASDTSLLPDAASLDRRASSAASRSRPDLG